MPPLHQPSDELLLKYVSGVLDPGIRLLVDVYLAQVPEADRRLKPFEDFGGEELASAPASALTGGSLDRALARIAGANVVQPGVHRPTGTQDIPHQRWRWAGRGTQIANVPVANAQTRVFFMRIAPGRAMLNHGHSGREFTLILEGSYRDGAGVYAAGSFVEAEGEEQHQPVVDSETECVCLIAMEGALVAPGLMGAAARWLMR